MTTDDRIALAQGWVFGPERPDRGPRPIPSPRIADAGPQDVVAQMRTMLTQYEPTYDEKIVGVNCWQLRRWIARLTGEPDGR